MIKTSLLSLVFEFALYASSWPRRSLLFTEPKLSKLLASISLAVGLSCVSIIALSQTKPEATAQQASAQSIAPPMPGTSTSEIVLLKNQLEDGRRFQEQLLSTVHWSLGTVASLAILMVGFGWFANFRMYERDKDAMQTDIRAQLLEEVRKSTAEVFMALTTKFSDQNEGVQKSLSKAVAELDAKIKSRVEAAEHKAENSAKSFDRRIKEINDELLKLQLTNELQDRGLWIQKEVYRNALQHSVSALDIANKIGFDYSTAEVLDLISNDIRVLVEKKTSIDNFLFGQLIVGLDAVKGSHTHAALGLKAKAAEIQIG